MSEMENDVKARANERRTTGNGHGQGPVTPDAPASGDQGSGDAEPSPAGPPDTAEAGRSAGRSTDPEVERLSRELETSRKRVDELARAYQAVSQDKEEFKRRLQREREQFLDVERGKVAVTLLEAIDELDRCLAAAPNDNSPLAQGVRLIRGNLLTKAQATGIERLELVGKPYDPNTAEAVDMELTADPDQDQAVVAEITAGYRLKDRVIRPARVKVAKYVEPAKA